MLLSVRATRRSMSIFIVAAVLSAAACGDSGTDGDDPGAAVVAVRLAVGNATVTIQEGGQVSGGPILIPLGTNTVNVAATFLDRSGNPVAGLDDFELRISPTATALVTFTRTGRFTGTLNRVASGGTTLTITLYHVVERHAERDWVVGITIQ